MPIDNFTETGQLYTFDDSTNSNTSPGSLIISLLGAYSAIFEPTSSSQTINAYDFTRSYPYGKTYDTDFESGTGKCLSLNPYIQMRHGNSSSGFENTYYVGRIYYASSFKIFGDEITASDIGKYIFGDVSYSFKLDYDQANLKSPISLITLVNFKNTYKLKDFLSNHTNISIIETLNCFYYKSKIYFYIEFYTSGSWSAPLKRALYKITPPSSLNFKSEYYKIRIHFDKDHIEFVIFKPGNDILEIKLNNCTMIISDTSSGYIEVADTSGMVLNSFYGNDGTSGLAYTLSLSTDDSTNFLSSGNITSSTGASISIAPESEIQNCHLDALPTTKFIKSESTGKYTDSATSATYTKSALDSKYVQIQKETWYSVSIDNVKSECIGIEYTTNIPIEEDLISIDVNIPKEINKDLLNPVSIDVKEDYETTLIDPITIDAAEDINEDLFPVDISIRDDFSKDFLSPVSVKVEWDKLEEDLFEISITPDAPIYQIELGPEFRSGWDDRKYLVFLNGTLLSKQTYNIIIPSPFNNYLKKMLYTTIGFSKKDRVEVFYIENQQNFANVPFNRETRVASYIYYAKSDNQKLIKVPYPNSSYRRSKDAFYLFNDKGEHLDCRYDYTVSADGRYVILADHAALELMMINYVVFTFCYVENRSINGQEEETDMFDTVNVSEITYEYSYSIQDISNTSGLVTFSPAFTGWPDMRQDNFMLFGNSVFIEPERYELVSNNQIQFLDANDKLVANTRRYTMCIPVKETKPQKLATNQVRYEVVLLENEDSTDKSTFFMKPPTEGDEWYPFLIFKGSVLLDVKEQYEYDEINNIVRITDSSCYLKPGRHLTVVYFNKSYTDLKKENRYIKMKFEANTTGMTEIPKNLYKNTGLQFDPSNLLLFINGVFLEPERYTILPGNWIKFNPAEEIAGYEEPYEDKMFTAIYLIQYANPDSNSEGFNDEWGQKEVDSSEDNDETRYDELYSYVKRKP